MPAPTTGKILNEAIAGYGQVNDAIQGGVAREQAIGQERLLGTTQAALGGIDEEAFLAKHPEFRDGYQNAKATGDNPSRWLELAINEASYINPSEVPRSGGITGTLGATAGQLSGVQNTANTATRTAGVADVKALSGDLAAANRAANPELYGTLGQAKALLHPGTDGYAGYKNAVLGQQTVGGYTAQGYSAAQAAPVDAISATQIQQGQLGQGLYNQAVNAGPSGAANTLQQRAQQLAASTGQLSPEELRAVQQGSREAFAARGMEMSNPAIAGEIGARIAAQRSRQTEDLNMAAGLNQAYTQDLTANRGFATGVYGQDIALQGQNQGANLAASQSNQSTALNTSLANQAATNTASQFTANANNQAGQYNTTLAAQQQQQGISNLGVLGQVTQGQTEADRAYALNLAAGYQGASPDYTGAILGQTSNSVAQAGGVLGAATGANPDLSGNLALTTGVAQDAQMTAFNAEEAARIAAANRKGALTGQILGAVGTIGGAALGVPSIGAAAGKVVGKVLGG